MTIPRYSANEIPHPEPTGGWVLVDDVLTWIRDVVHAEEVTYADGSTEMLCSDWCWGHALDALTEALGGQSDEQEVPR